MKLADLIPFRRRRTLSRYADDKAVLDFAQVAKDQGMDMDFGDDHVARLAELIQDDSPPDEKRIAEIARLMGQTDDKAP